MQAPQTQPLFATPSVQITVHQIATATESIPIASVQWVTTKRGMTAVQGVAAVIGTIFILLGVAVQLSGAAGNGSMDAIIPLGIGLVGVTAIGTSQAIMASPYYVVLTTTAGKRQLPPLTQQAAIACMQAIGHARRQAGA